MVKPGQLYGIRDRLWFVLRYCVGHAGDDCVGHVGDDGVICELVCTGHDGHIALGTRLCFSADTLECNDVQPKTGAAIFRLIA